MRERVRDALESVPRERFLVYVMGPYTSVSGDDGEQFDRLATLRDRLRTESGVNAFLATDPEIPLEELDAATQTIAFARASNAVIFVLPRTGDNLGVGVEVGAVLEDSYESEASERADRTAVIHQSGVTSAMLAGVTRRWDATVYAYDDEATLTRRAKTFVANVIAAEETGRLARLE